MQRSSNSTGFDLMGYKPYQFVGEFNGTWVPFNQTETGYVGILNLFKAIQKRHRLPNPTEDAAACQGITLLYVENDCSMKALSTAKPELGGIKPKALAEGVNYQARYSGTVEARDAMTDPKGKIKCKMLGADKYPHRIDITEIFDSIEKSEGNVFFITGYCDGRANGLSYDAAHAFVIANDGQRWKFFEAQRGEVSFGSFKELKAWFNKEATQGTLQEFGARYPVEVRQGVTRRYTDCTLDVYKKNFSHHLQSRDEPSMQKEKNLADFISEVDSFLINKKMTPDLPAFLDSLEFCVRKLHKGNLEKYKEFTVQDYLDRKGIHLGDLNTKYKAKM